jgi:hypothetical protein
MRRDPLTNLRGRMNRESGSITGRLLRKALCLSAILTLPFEHPGGIKAQTDGAQPVGGKTGQVQPGHPTAQGQGAGDSDSPESTYKVIIKKKKAEAEAAIKDDSAVDAVVKQLAEASANVNNPPANPVNASTPAAAAAAPIWSAAELQRAQAMVTVVQQTRQVALDKLAQAEHADNPAIAMVLTREAADAAEQANHLARSLLPGGGENSGGRDAAPPPGAVSAGKCEQWFSCRQAMAVAAGDIGFDSSGNPQNGDVVDLRGGGTNFFHSTPDASALPPGGIKFSGERANGLALALDVTAVDFDPIHNRITLIGKSAASGTGSGQPFDLDIFSDVLRLAAEKFDPFFSLEPNNSADWDNMGAWAALLLRDRYGSPQQIAERVRAVSPPPVRRGKMAYYYATLNQIDPQLDRRNRQSHDLSVKVVFSPSWLRYSKVGWILYRADLAIKGIAAGFVMRGEKIVPSPAWGMEDFDPIWLHDGSAGRADFELDESPAETTATGVDLTAVRPKLYLTGRKPGTSEDTKPSPGDLAITNHFSHDWREYAEQLPELAELEEVYRAYVAAHYLIRHHPALAERILQMPRPQTPALPPLYIELPPVLYAATRAGEPVVLDSERHNYYAMGGGFSGGTEFKIEAVHYASGGGENADSGLGWLRRVSSKSNAAAPWTESDGNVAAVLEIEGTPAPTGWMAVTSMLVALLVAFGAWVSVVLGKHPWQKLESNADQHPICLHCVGVHRRVGLWSLCGDAAAAAALLYLAALPFLLAGRNWKDGGVGRFALLAVVAAGVALAIPMIGAGFLALLNRGRTKEAAGWFAEFLLGARLLMLAAGLLVLVNCLLGNSPAAVLFLVAGPELGERMLSSSGGPETFAPILIAGSLCALAATLAEWVAPFAFGSRPMLNQTETQQSHLHF